MKKIKTLHHVTLVASTFALALGMMFFMPQDAAAYVEWSKDGTCIECHAEGFEDQAAAGGGVEQTGDKADDVGGASGPISHEPAYEPLPIKKHEPTANNTLLGGGLGFAAVVIGGAFALDKRKK